jgi:hypothetical protein
MSNTSSSNPFNDGPLLVVAEQVQKLLLEHQNVLVYQKWTCSHCGVRQTMAAANTFFTSGSCEECHTISPIEKCGYMAHFGAMPLTIDEHALAIEDSKRMVEERERQKEQKQ